MAGNKANIIIGGGIGVLIALAVGLGLAKTMLFYPSAPDADFPAPQSQAEARAQDLEYLKLYVSGYDRSYPEAARQEALALINTLQKKAGELTPAGFELAVRRVVALADNGHSNVWIGPQTRRFHRVPVRGHWFEDGYVVVRAKKGYQHLLGGKLTHVGDAPVGEVRAAFRPYYGGSDEGFEAYALAALLENTSFLAELGFIASENKARMTFALADGSEQDVTLPADPPNPDGARVYTWQRLQPYTIAGEDEGWVGAAEGEGGAPQFLKGRKHFRMAELPEVGGLYVQFRANDDRDGEVIEDFVRDVSQRAGREHPEVVVFDQRFNGGGDYTKTRGLMNSLPGKIAEGGRIYVITGNATFSAGISSVAFLKAAGGDAVTIVGEPVGDRLRMWGETNDFILPNSGIGITAARGLHDYAAGCHDVIKCYWSDFTNNVAVGSLTPDYPAPYTSADFLSHRDPALEKILELEQARR